MNRRLLLKIISYLKDAKKATFLVKLSTREKLYNVTISKEVIDVQITDKATNINELSLVNCDIETILTANEYKVESITETIYTMRNEIYTSTFYNCLDYVQVYLPVFRVLGDQVVCIVKNPSGKLEKVFYVNGRIFLFKKIDEVLELDQTDLRKMLNSCSIVDFEKLSRRYSYSSIFSSSEQYCKKNKLKLEIKKFGVACS